MLVSLLRYCMYLHISGQCSSQEAVYRLIMSLEECADSRHAPPILHLNAELILPNAQPSDTSHLLHA
jgi:hypothetical protein